MSVLNERVAYLRGLSEGLGISEATPEGKLLTKIVEALDAFALEFEMLSDVQEELEEYVDSIDEDLEALEEDFYDEEEEEEDFLEIQCPHCDETVFFDMDMLTEDELICPVCDQAIISSDEEEDAE